MAERRRYQPPMAGQRLSWESPLTFLPFGVRNQIATAVDASRRFHELAEVLGYTYEEACATEVRSQGNLRCLSSPTLLLLQQLAAHNCNIGRLQRAFESLNHPAMRCIPEWLGSRTSEPNVHHSGTQVTEPQCCNCETCNNYNRYATPPSISGGCGKPNCSCLRPPPPYDDRPVGGPSFQTENTKGIRRSTSVEIPNSLPKRLLPRGGCDVERVPLARALPHPVSESSCNSMEQTSCCLCDQCRLMSDHHETKALRTFDAPETLCPLRCSPTREHNRPNTNHDIHQTQVKSQYSDDLTNRVSEVRIQDSDQTQVKSPHTESLINGNIATENRGQNIHGIESVETIYVRSFPIGRNSWHGSSSFSSFNRLSSSSSEGSNLSRTKSRNSSADVDPNSFNCNILTQSLSHGDSNLVTSNVPSRNGEISPPAYSAPRNDEGIVSLPRHVAPRPVRIFKTYSYNLHRDDLRFLRELEALCLLLKQCGIRIKIDVDDDSVSERRINKLDWLETHVKQADYVIACITPTYYADIQPAPATAVPMESQLNARYIFDLLRREFVENHSRHSRVIPVLFPSSGANESHVPEFMRSTIVYSFPFQADNIIRILLGQDAAFPRG